MGLLGVNNNPTGSLGLNISPTLDAKAKQAEEDEAKRKRAEQSLKLQNLADTLRMVNANKSGNTQGVALYSNRLSDRRAAEQAKLKKLADQKKRDDFYNSLNANQKMIFDMKQAGMPDSYIKSQFYADPKQRRIVVQNGVQYYVDTGEPVLPNAPGKTPPKKTKSDFVVEILEKIQNDANYKLTESDQRILDTISETDPMKILLRNRLNDMQTSKFNNENTSQTGIVTVTTQQQYDALPSGSLFIEDGKTYRKP